MKTDFGAMKQMLEHTEKCTSYNIHRNIDGTIDITFDRDDCWYDVIFHFDRFGRLVQVE